MNDYKNNKKKIMTPEAFNEHFNEIRKTVKRIQKLIRELEKTMKGENHVKTDLR